MFLREPSEMTPDQLLAETLELTEHRAQTYISEERKAELTVRINSLLFEYRYQNGEFSGTAA